MTHLEGELAQLKKAVLEMMRLANTQLEKSKWAFLALDTELADEIIHNEKRMNAMELSIDRDCEDILALFQPVATDLRFVISMLKINSDIERIGDHADGIANYVIEMEKPIDKEALEATQIPQMFDITLSMLGDIYAAFDVEDTTLARKIFHKDSELNKLNRNAARIIKDLIIKDQEAIRPMLYLFSTIRKLERVGDHVKNIAEDIIFHLEAKVLKHKKDSKK